MAGHLAVDGSEDLLGYSLGGRVALQLALDHPGRIRRLVLVSSGPGIADPAERERRRQRDERLAQILDEDGISPFTAWWESSPALKPARPLPGKMVAAWKPGSGMAVIAHPENDKVGGQRQVSDACVRCR